LKPYRILSMDGGGIRGILTARLLERADERHPGFLSGVDLFAGTSTGGLLALGLAAGMTPAQLRQMYSDLAGKVFADSLLDNLKDLGNLIGAEYSNEPLKEVLESYFKGVTLSQLPKRVLIPAFMLDNQGEGPGDIRMWKMKFFHNYPGPDSDGGELVVDVAMRTSVAPSYFPTYQGYIDGGVAASNPAMSALAQALHNDTGGQVLQDLVLLSMGTGFNPHYLPICDADWGLVQWAPHLINIMLEGSVGMVNYQCRQLLNERFFRIDPPLPRPIGLGSIKYIPELLETANNANIRPFLNWVSHYFIEISEDLC
jgi:uncharacterized protein